MQSFKALSEKGSGLIPALNGLGASLVSWLGVYLQATVWVALIFIIRVMILFLSLPLFGLVILTGIVDGLVRRDLRRYGAGYESSFVYHHAKRFIKPALYGPCMLYLAWPTAVWPNLFLLPSAMLVGGVLENAYRNPPVYQEFCGTEDRGVHRVGGSESSAVGGTAPLCP